MANITYEPPPSLASFFSSEKFIALACGPIGSTKTTAGLLKVAYHASRMAPCLDGIRRSRCVIVRNTREQLKDTTIPDFLKWYPDGQAGMFLKSDLKFMMKFGDIECEVLFRALEDSKDVRKLLSLQLSFAIFDEFREINPDVFAATQGRVGRYPDKMLVPENLETGFPGGCVTDGGEENKFVWGMTNPPDMDTYWEKFLTEPPSNAHVTIQPGGTSQAADWVQWLPRGYYENLMEANTDEWVDIYVHAKFGKSLAGRPVWGLFDSDYHVSKTPLRPIVSESYPLIIGQDFGLTPACSISQLNPHGQLLTFRSLVSQGMGILRFMDELLIPMLRDEFPGHPVLVVGDPAGVQRSQTDEKSVFDMMRMKGFNVIPAPSNLLTPRLGAVEELLSKQIGGKPAHLFDPGAGPILTAMRGGYRYRKKKAGDYEISPEKNEWSHVADGHQYAALHVASGAVLPGTQGGTQRREVKKSHTGGWT